MRLVVRWWPVGVARAACHLLRSLGRSLYCSHKVPSAVWTDRRQASFKAGVSAAGCDNVPRWEYFRRDESNYTAVKK